MSKNSLQNRVFQLLAVLTIIATIFPVFFYYCYAYFLRYDTARLIPQPSDYLPVLFSTLLTVLISFFVSLSFARKSLPSITSIATAARQIAEGNLSSRARLGNFRLKELDLLVQDFNLMAERIEIMADDMKRWNAAIAHELRTPVTVIKGGLEGIADGLLKADANIISSFMKNIEGLSRLIDDLRTVSLADSNQLTLYREWGDINQEIESILKPIEPQFAKVGKKLVHELSAEICYADHVRLMQAILALLHNALDYADEGVVYVKCWSTDKMLHISIEDEGPGVDESLRNTIFNSFYRVEPLKKTAQGSSGLGLSVVRAITQSHGGSVKCGASELGGALFIMSIPI
ncbi:HAMP domain-containing histidine kinase [Salmonella enterica]|nr:HAMP domain-containing histidine kinase [Salmonella enterica]